MISTGIAIKANTELNFELETSVVIFNCSDLNANNAINLKSKITA